MSTLSANDDDDEEEFISYYENALKCQLVIEKTIVDINRIKNVDQPIYLICDTNSIDLKVNTDILLWNKFLSTTNVPHSKFRPMKKISKTTIRLFFISKLQKKKGFKVLKREQLRMPMITKIFGLGKPGKALKIIIQYNMTLT